MNKSELITTISEKSGLMKKDAVRVLNALVTSVQESVGNGEKVTIVGFGTFEAKSRAQRKGRNPQTMEEMIIPPSTVPVFRAGKEFKAKVNR